MADENSEHDTFVSVDMFAPTQSSIGAPNEDTESEEGENDTVSLSEYIGDGGEDLLSDDILDHVSHHNNNHIHTLHDEELDNSNPNPSPQYSRAMRQNANCHDSAFMWTLTNETSPEAFRQNDATQQHTGGPADDTLSLGDDDDDVCGSFDTGSFSENHSPPQEQDQHHQHPDNHQFSHHHEHQIQNNQDGERTPDVLPSTRFLEDGHTAGASSSQYTPVARRRDSSDQSSPQVPCSSERPPLPPPHLSTTSGDPSLLSRRPSSLNTSTENTLSEQQNSTATTDTEASAPQEQYSNSMSNMVEYDPKFNEATHGYSTSIISNPFAGGQRMDPDLPNNLVIISKTGPVNDEDNVALAELAASPELSKCRLVKRLVETIAFQNRQLEQVKESEVNLAGSILNGELRRYSETAHERSFALDNLIEEVDEQREQVSELEDENAALLRKLRASEEKVKQVEDYYSNFVGNFKLSDNNIVSVLENVHDGVDRFRSDSMEQSEKKSTEVEDYARRLLEMEDIVADSRKRLKKMETENDELRAALDGNILEKENEDDGENMDSPMKNFRRFTSPSKSRVEEQAEYTRMIEEQHIEIDNLRMLNLKAHDDQKKLQDAFLSLNVEVEESRSKARTLQKQRDNAENKNRDISTAAASEKKNFVKLSNEMSKNIVQVINELDQKEADIRILRNDLNDREGAYRSLQCSNQDIEDQLQAFTEAALDRSRSRNSNSENGTSQPLVDAFIESLQKELSKAQTLLQQRTNDVERVKKAMQDQDESIITLQKECSRLQAAAAVRRRSGSVSSPSAASTSSSNAEEERFLRRLSKKLGCSSSNSHELIEQLAKRVETLMVDRNEFQEANEKLRVELTERERGVHKLRSEMQAEISVLKAESVHQENLKVRAQEEMKSAEDRLLHVLNEGDLSRRESMGDITSSSIGTRAWIIGDEDATVTGGGSRRGSMMSSMAGDDTIRWNDPIIDAAVQSVNELIGTKDSLADRNRELREKLQQLINALAANDEDGTARAVILQSKELQDELTGVVGLQQDIIDKLTQSHSNNNTTQTVRTSIADDNSLPHIHQDKSRFGNNERDPTFASPISTSSRAPLGEATRFLDEQLQSTRALYSDKLRANVELCGVIEELQEEVQQYKTANHNVETALTQLKETHDSFVSRLSYMTGAERSVVALEDFIRASLHDMMTLQSELERKEIEERLSSKRITGLLAQKRLLSHMISLYQTKYRMNILAPSDEQRVSLKRRLRIRVFAVIAIKKLFSLRNLPQDATVEHDLPEIVDISHVEQNEVCMMEATLAISAVPRLENALVEKDQEIGKLESSILSLNKSANDIQQLQAPGEMPRSSFVYEEDVLNRKNDLSRRLQKMIREKEELEDRLSREKQARLTVEAKVVKYMEKVSTYKKRLGKVSSHAEAKENAYKSAIRYLKNKADKAVKNDFNLDDENVAPWELPKAEVEGGGNRDNGSREPNAATRAMLHERLMRAESELADEDVGTANHEELKGYAGGLRRAIQRLEKPLVFAKRSEKDNGNRDNRA